MARVNPLSIVAAALLLAGCRVLPVRVVGQEASSWCWAACVEMVVEYLEKGATDVRQCDLATQQYGALTSTDCCAGLRPCEAVDKQCDLPLTFGLFDGLGYAASIALKGQALGSTQVMKEINARRPFVYMANSHFVVVRGYIAGSTDTVLVTNDPWPPCKGDWGWTMYPGYAASQEVTYYGIHKAP